MIPNLYFDREGEPISQERWGELKSRGEEYWRIGGDRIDELWVSTVWVGLDVGLGACFGGASEIFETMVFHNGDTSLPLDSYTRRYATFAEAEAGHKETLVLLGLDVQVSE